jgi:hypothetical protein
MSDTGTIPDLTASDEVLATLVEIMRSGVRPDVIEAQRLLLHRLATQGDVFPSRVPAPLNITEVGGYLNLLDQAGQFDSRMQAITAALGIAAPPSAAAATDVPVGFAVLPNHRPPGPAQPTIPPQVTVRADFHGLLLAALDTIAAAGAALPLRSPRFELPATVPADRALLGVLGRTLEVMPGTVLVDPATDPVAIARLETPSTDRRRLVAAASGPGAPAAASWVTTQCSPTQCVELPPATASYVEVAPIMIAAGWYHPQPLAEPQSVSDRGDLTAFVNTTGLVAGETTLGDELRLLYTPAQIARSALAGLVGHVWDGARFAPAVS